MLCFFQELPVHGAYSEVWKNLDNIGSKMRQYGAIADETKSQYDPCNKVYRKKPCWCFKAID